MSPELERLLRKEYWWVLPETVLLTDIKDGWYSLLNHTLAVVFVRSETGGGPPLKIHRIWQCMGMLRIEYEGGDDHIHGAIDLATNLSVHLCEICGNHVFPRRMHFHYPRCIAHYDSEDKIEIFTGEPSESHPAFKVDGLEQAPRPKRDLKLRLGS